MTVSGHIDSGAHKMPKKKKKEPIFLEVKYGDNDFGWTVAEAMERLFNDIADNTTYRSKNIYNYHSLYKYFKILHLENALDPMIRGYVAAYSVINSLEFCSRGLKDGRTPFASPDTIKESTKPEGEYEKCFGYLTDFKPKFHMNGEFATVWQNGEHCALDLITGKAFTF